MQEPITSFVLEAPAGPIRITAQCEQGKAKKITLRNAPAFVRPEDMELTIEVPKGDVGAVTVSVAYGGMWYAIVDAASVGLKIQLEDAAELVRIGEMIKIATMEQHPVEVLHTSSPSPTPIGPPASSPPGHLPSVPYLHLLAHSSAQCVHPHCACARSTLQCSHQGGTPLCEEMPATAARPQTLSS